MKTVIKFGIIFGVINILMRIATLYIDRSSLMTPSIIGMSLGFLIALGILFLALRAIKLTNGGFLSLGEGIKSALLIFALGTFISGVFDYALYNYIDPSLVTEFQDNMETSEEAFKTGLAMTGITGVEADIAYDEFLADKDKPLNPFMDPSSITVNLLGWFISLFIPGFILALVVAFLNKNERADSEEEPIVNT